MLYLAGIIITFFLVVLLVSKREKSEADKILALWLFVTGIHLLLFYIHFTNKYPGFPYLLGLELPLPLAHGPFLYLYTSSLTNHIRNRKTGLFHFIPLVIAYLPLLRFFALPANKKIFVYQHNGVGYELYMTVLFSAIVVSGIVYSLLSLRKLLRHQKNIVQQFSDTEKINLAWLRYLILGTIAIWLAVIFGDEEHTFAMVALYIFFIGYFGIKQVGIFTYKRPAIDNSSLKVESERPILNRLPDDKPAEETIPLKIKYEKSGLSSADQAAIHKELTEVMQKEKLYKNPELTLAELSQRLGVHPNILSQVINSAEQKNFYDFINCQRVEEFKQMVKLSANQQFTLLSLAFECGFNSKTSFNRNFKKVTELSPTEYLKQLNINLE